MSLTAQLGVLLLLLLMLPLSLVVMERGRNVG